VNRYRFLFVDDGRKLVKFEKYKQESDLIHGRPDIIPIDLGDRMKEAIHREIIMTTGVHPALEEAITTLSTNGLCRLHVRNSLVLITTTGKFIFNGTGSALITIITKEMNFKEWRKHEKEKRIFLIKQHEYYERVDSKPGSPRLRASKNREMRLSMSVRERRNEC